MPTSKKQRPLVCEATVIGVNRGVPAPKQRRGHGPRRELRCRTVVSEQGVLVRAEPAATGTAYLDGARHFVALIRGRRCPLRWSSRTHPDSCLSIGYSAHNSFAWIAVTGAARLLRNHGKHSAPPTRGRPHPRIPRIRP